MKIEHNLSFHIRLLPQDTYIILKESKKTYFEPNIFNILSTESDSGYFLWKGCETFDNCTRFHIMNQDYKSYYLYHYDIDSMFSYDEDIDKTLKRKSKIINIL